MNKVDRLLASRVLLGSREVLTRNYWKRVKEKALHAERKRAAISFVTEDLVGFGSGDVLVVNASLRAIRSGVTTAKLLLQLHDLGVEIYNCPNLHGKVLLLDGFAVIGSGNMSNMSNRPISGWQEAGLITNDGIVAAGVDSFIEQLSVKKALLERDAIVALTKIKVDRRTGNWSGESAKDASKVGALGNRTWIIGLHDITLAQDEAKLTQATLKRVSEATNWMRTPGNGKFATECREGDSVIIIWRPKKNSKVTVYRAAAVLRRQRRNKVTFLYYREVSGRYAMMTFGRFTKMLKQVGYPRQVKPGSTQLVSLEMADAIAKKWNKAAKS